MKIDYNKHLLSWNKYYFKNKTKVNWGFDIPDSHVMNFEKFYSLNKNISNNKILDVGCGYGKNSKIFIEKGYNYFGIDISKEPIEYCKKNIGEDFFSLGNILNFISENKYDLILDAGCLHVNDKRFSKFIIKKYYDLLEENGFLFLRIFKSEIDDNLEPLFIIDNVLPVWGFTENDLKKLISPYFTIEKIILDPVFYDENEVFYLYLKKKT